MADIALEHRSRTFRNESTQDHASWGPHAQLSIMNALRTWDIDIGELVRISTVRRLDAMVNI